MPYDILLDSLDTFWLAKSCNFKNWKVHETKTILLHRLVFTILMKINDTLDTIITRS